MTTLSNFHFWQAGYALGEKLNVAQKRKSRTDDNVLLEW